MAKDEQIEDIHRHIVPYVYREFPKHLVKADGSFIVVADEAAQKNALAAGWFLSAADAQKAAAKAEKANK